MFGILRPCRHLLSGELHADWIAQLCGMCLALRDDHGHVARLVTNYDGLVISALVEAQRGRGAGRRSAKPCALRGMRAASVAYGDGARLAATVSLVLAAGKIDDHLQDGDLPGGVRRALAQRVAEHWGSAAAETATQLGFRVAVLTDPIARQPAVESAVRAGSSILTITEPTESATGAAFSQSALLAGCPQNVEPLREAGRMFGRVAHLLDAVEDRGEDAAAGKFNPILATGLGPPAVRALCDDALLDIRLALADVELVDRRLVHALLVHELDRSVQRTFGDSATCGHQRAVDRPDTEREPAPTALNEPTAPHRWSEDTDDADEVAHSDWKRPGLVAGCLAWAGLCGSCQICCADEYVDPWTGKRREGCGANCNDCGNCCGGCSDGGDCCNACDCCDCCNCP